MNDVGTRTVSENFGRWLVLLDSLILDSLIIARLVFDGPPENKWDGENLIPRSNGGGYVRAKRSHAVNGRDLVQGRCPLPPCHFDVDADNSRVVIQRDNLCAHLCHEGTLP